MLNRFITVKEQFVLIFFASTIVLGAVVAYWLNSGSENSDGPLVVPDEIKATPAEISSPSPNALHESPETTERMLIDTPSPVAVSIRGAVERPGVYRVTGDARVEDLLEEAGGVLDNADLRDINLAAPLIDGTTLTIPEKPEVGPDGRWRQTGSESAAAYWNPPQYTISGWNLEQAASGSGQSQGTSQTATATGTGLIDLNSAPPSELETLPGIGPALAGRIVSYRSKTPFRSPSELMNVSGIGEKRFEAVREMVTVRP